jgi:hypothetical protein
MLILLIVPAVAGAIVTVPVPVGLSTTLALAGENVAVDVVVNVVNLPVAAVVAPIFVLSILPTVAGAIVTEPVPVGEIVTVALAGLSVVVFVDVNPLNVLDNPELTAPVKPIPPDTTNVPVEVVVEAVFCVNVTAPLAVKLVNAAELATLDPIGVFCKLPAYNLSDIPTPPVTTNVPDVVDVDPVFCVNVTAALAVNVVTAAELAVTDPIGVFCKLPAYNLSDIPTPPVTTSVPLVVLVDPVFCVSVTAALAVNVVNAPVLLVEAPILMLLIVPSVAGLIVTTPVPVGLNTTLAFAGLIAAAPLLAVNAPPTVSAFRTVVVPVVAPKLTVVAACPMLSVVALALNKVAVPVDVVVMSAPFTARSPVIVVLPVIAAVPPTAKSVPT